ncbi:MAG: hypothetical protein QXF41_03250 [Candidatus Micrarchaeaceae archaeon]
MPFLFFVVYANKDTIKQKILNPLTLSFIASSIVFSLLPRYMMELSVVSILFIKDLKRAKLPLILFVITVMVISASFIAMSNDNASPYFYNYLTSSSNETMLMSTSFMQSTVPLSDAKNIVTLFKTVPENGMVVTMLYMVSFAYESGIPVNHVINAGENYTLFINNCNFYTLHGYIVYTVWWSTNGWYGIKSLPSNFVAVKSIGAYSLYQFS